MKRLIVAFALAATTLSWAEFEWPTADSTIQFNNRAIFTVYKDGTTWAHRADVAAALGLDTEGDDLVDIQKAFRDKGVLVKKRSNGTIDAVVPQASARTLSTTNRKRRYSAGGYSGGAVRDSNTGPRRTKNYTPFKDQRDEYLNTHTTNGRIFNMATGEYVSGQENRVFVEGYTNKNGTYVNPVTRRYPSTRSSSSSSGRSGTGYPSSPFPSDSPK